MAENLNIEQTFWGRYPSQGRSGNGEPMSFLKKLFSRNTEPRQRVRICVECGMPVAEHKDSCSIFRTQREMDARRTQATAERA